MSKKTAKGFMLIEILASVLVFSVGILFLVQCLSNITGSNQHIRDNYRAMLLIDNLLNRLYSGEVIGASGTESMENKDFSWQIDYVNSFAGLKSVILNIKWPEKGKDYSASLNYEIIPKKE